MQSASDTASISASGTISPHGRILASWVLDNLPLITEGVGAACGIGLGSYVGGMTHAEGWGRLLFWSVLVYRVATGLGPPAVRFATFQGSDESCAAEFEVGLAKVVGFLLPSAASQAKHDQHRRRRDDTSDHAAHHDHDNHAPRIHPRLPVSAISRCAAYC